MDATYKSVFILMFISLLINNNFLHRKIRNVYINSTSPDQFIRFSDSTTDQVSFNYASLIFQVKLNWWDLIGVFRMLSAKSTTFFLVIIVMVWTAASAPASQETIPEAADSRSIILPQSINPFSFSGLSSVMRSFLSLIFARFPRWNDSSAIRIPPDWFVCNASQL